ncbi:DUF4166 domain-containing protein [Verrucomicrobiota bacterium sgz303538]
MPDTVTSHEERGGETGEVRNRIGLYPTLIGNPWSQLPVAVRNAHCEGYSFRAAGTFTIRRGSGFLARLICCVLRMPPSDEVATELVVTVQGEREYWERTFGRHRLLTVQLPSADGLLIERFSFIQFCFSLSARPDGLYFEQQKAALQIGPLGRSIPAFCAPVVSASEHAADGSGTRVSVKVWLPFVGSLIEYNGTLGQPARHP